MPETCIATRCNNTAEPEKGISMVCIGILLSTWKTQWLKKKGKMAADFDLVRRKKWKPSKTMSLCSIHFKEDDFQYGIGQQNEKITED